MLKADSQIKFRFDEALSTIREMYNRLCAEDKAALKAWTAVLADARKAQPSICLYATLKLDFALDLGEGEFMNASIPIAALPEAFECWDRGEPYAPNALEKLVG
jgi:hypothetical protein